MENSEITQTEDFYLDNSLTNFVVKNKKQTIFDYALDADIKEVIKSFDNKSYLDNLNNEKQKRNDKLYFKELFLKSNYIGKHKVEYTKSIQKWKGKVTEIFETYFIAELEDLILGGTKEIAKIEKDSIDTDDKSLITIGASFYWSIYQNMKESGQVEKVSKFRFQRLSSWTNEEINEIEDRAEKLLQKFKFT